MKKIPSFTIDHNRLQRGVFVSRQDFTPSGDTITTFDIRMTLPNREAALDPKALHAMEHLAATFLRNHPEWGSKIIYWGPMGCCTGNYLVVAGNYSSEDMISLLKQTMAFIRDFEGEIPGATPADCGNYTFMDLTGALEAARGYLEVLENPSYENMHYPSPTD